MPRPRSSDDVARAALRGRLVRSRCAGAEGPCAPASVERLSASHRGRPFTKESSLGLRRSNVSNRPSWQLLSQQGFFSDCSVAHHNPLRNSLKLLQRAAASPASFAHSLAWHGWARDNVFKGLSRALSFGRRLPSDRMAWRSV
eukprot:6175864-Pleurochrysis_carterae.AAC.1